MRIHDALIGALLALLGAVVIWHVGSFPTVAGQSYGPDLFPRLVGIGLVIFGGGLILRDVKAQGGLPGAITLPGGGELGRGVIASLYVLVSVLAVVLLGETLGVQIIAFGILVTGLFAGYRRPLPSLALALALTVVFDLIFRVLLRVPLPSGPLTGIL